MGQDVLEHLKVNYFIVSKPTELTNSYRAKENY